MPDGVFTPFETFGNVSSLLSVFAGKSVEFDMSVLP
jgi:hypothetical protein